LVACLIAAGGWLGQVFREDLSYSPRAQARVWERVVGPVGVPVSALALTAFIVICISRVLLAVNEKVSVAVALVTAVVVLAGFAFVASRPRSGRVLLGLLGGIALVALAAAGIAGAAKGERKFEPAAAVNANLYSLTARNTQFSKSQLTVKAGTPITIVFHNDDPAIYHNVAIYTAPKGGSPVADGQPIQGVNKKAYVFTIPQPGTYAFRCDFHANMVGTLTVQ
jgi:plastocyanin